MDDQHQALKSVLQLVALVRLGERKEVFYFFTESVSLVTDLERLKYTLK